jgi:uncharacterized membrane protein YhhN
MTLWAPVVAASICVGGLLWAEVCNRRLFSWLFKPLAAACFIWLAWIAGAAQSQYGNWLLAGLAACWLGDVLLIPDHKGSFLAGLGSFLLGHLLYAIAFLHLPANTYGALLAAPLALALAALSWRWLQPHVPGEMRLAVAAYISVISAMLLCAATVANTAAGVWIIAGALGFAISDLAVARQQFVKPAAINRVWGTPLYFGSQMALAWTPALI